MKIDPITDLLMFESFCKSASALLEDDSKSYLLISLNLDEFRTINQYYGYQKGDILLHDFAVFFQSTIPNILLACRENADRFIFLLDITGTDISSFTSIVEKQHADFIEDMQRSYPLSRISFHAGAYSVKKEDSNIAKILDDAELARRSIKASTEQHIAYYDDFVNHHNISEQDILPLFDFIAEEKRLVLYLQPKFDLLTKQIIGAEALARIRNHSGFMIAPSDFIPVLEKTGLIYQLDLMVLEHTLKLLSGWLDEGLTPVPISVNISRLDFYSPDFLKITNEMLEKYHVPKKYLEFEITETLFKNQLDFMSNHINALRGQGYAFSIDDFGKDNTSLLSVGMLPIDVIKIDQHIIQKNLRSPKGRSVLTKLFEMLSEIGLQTICEGIESSEDALLLQSCGCRYVQGYLYDKPLPVDRFYKKYIEFRYKSAVI